MQDRRVPHNASLWDTLLAYTHQHIGAINSTLSVKGKPHCTSYPHYGADPHDAPGNEKGYAVGFHMCISPNEPTQAIHVNKGDTLTLTAYASVESEDTRSQPIPGGKHRLHELVLLCCESRHR